MPLVLHGVLIGLSAILHLWADYSDRPSLAYVFKPLTTILIIGLALRGGPAISETYRWLITVGLVFSLAGDVFLMLPGDRFVAGLASFLVAQICYITAFVSRAGAPSSMLAGALFLLYGLGLVYLLWPYLGGYKVPVIFYGLALVTMGWLAMEPFLDTGTRSALFAAIGAILFILSDSVLAWNRFVDPFRLSQLVVMTTYVAAQALIAYSVFGR